MYTFRIFIFMHLNSAKNTYTKNPVLRLLTLLHNEFCSTGKKLIRLYNAYHSQLGRNEACIRKDGKNPYSRIIKYRHRIQI
jgi:hypothetical protein